MSYHVLARKWRPRDFKSIAGQEHILRALINALDKKRLHHAYLFTGIQGTGKTTIARILAKCLNCEEGIRSQPCGQCNACKEIDSGRFIDLIEVDAASRTRVEDTRELLDNVQYVPTRGRFKIYLIDEVHMLSSHSFNALLKTLEEPPEHVKFLLATTDPQKLPATVLSRCLQFHLKKLPAERISHYLQSILEQEKIAFEENAITHISQAANGSMRDALSILDQAIAFNLEKITTTDTQAMLGTIEQNYVEELLQALAEEEPQKLLNITRKLAELAADFDHVLEKLISSLHQITIAQLVPDAIENTPIIKKLSESFKKEEIQLYYQIALLGRRDLPFACDPQSGFEMTLLRMLTFRPTEPSPSDSSEIQPPHPQNNKAQTTPPQNKSALDSPLLDASEWANILPKLQLSGMCFALAANCNLKYCDDHKIELALHKDHAALLNEKLKSRLNEKLNDHFGQTLKLIIQLDENKIETPAKREKQQANKQHEKAITTIKNDPNVQSLVEKFGATVEPNLISSK